VILSHQVVVWRSGSALVSINEVNLRRARLVLGWVTVSGFSSRCGTFISVCDQPPIIHERLCADCKQNLTVSLRYAKVFSFLGATPTPPGALSLYPARALSTYPSSPPTASGSAPVNRLAYINDKA